MTTIGIIILGNSGAGKSCLANVILGEEAFEHEVQAGAVTLRTESKEHKINGKLYAIYNIPGLIEADQERIDVNIREIDRAFVGHPYSVVVYVFGSGNGGRIQNEDIIAFNAISKAYPLGSKSLVIVVNNIPKMPANKISGYELDTASNLKGLLNIGFEHICFIYQIDLNSTDEKKVVQTKLLDKIKITLPKTHKKEKEIHLMAGELSKLRKEMAILQKQIEEERKKNEETRKEMEGQRELMRIQNLHIRERSPPQPTPYFVPVPVIQHSESPSYAASRICNPRNYFDPPRHLRKDGEPDRRYKENR